MKNQWRKVLTNQAIVRLGEVPRNRRPNRRVEALLKSQNSRNRFDRILIIMTFFNGLK